MTDLFSSLGLKILLELARISYVYIASLYRRLLNSSATSFTATEHSSFNITKTRGESFQIAGHFHKSPMPKEYEDKAALVTINRYCVRFALEINDFGRIKLSVFLV